MLKVYKVAKRVGTAWFKIPEVLRSRRDPALGSGQSKTRRGRNNGRAPFRKHERAKVTSRRCPQFGAQIFRLQASRVYVQLSALAAHKPHASFVHSDWEQFARVKFFTELVSDTLGES